ncbi:MAG TPA: hypothetical protein VFW95_08275 [Candidatus Limnocylindria bacterium]|nr:hypothetical protein [Candidatus Limnocylindria bacterium]
MTHRSKSSRLVQALAAALLLLSLTAGSVFAGEITGSGKPTPIKSFRAHSICSFSGLNDRTAGEGPTDTRVQNWGVTPLPELGHPGDSCNGHTGLLAGGGE